MHSQKMLHALTREVNVGVSQLGDPLDVIDPVNEGNDLSRGHVSPTFN